MISPADELALEKLLPRKHSKHGKKSLVWRQKNRSKRRKALANTFSRISWKHPVAILRERWIGKYAHLPENMPRPSFVAFKKRARKAVRA